MNVLQNSLETIRKRFYTRVVVLTFYLIGYSYLWSIDYRIALGIFMINWAASIEIP